LNVKLLGNININISAEFVAWYAAIIATFSALKVVYDILSDRRKINISYRTDVTIQGVGYDPEEKQFCIEIVNSGKRVVKIVNVGYFQTDGTKSIFSDSVFNLESRILTDNNPSTSYTIPLNDSTPISKIWYLYALDGRGKTYKKYLHKFGRFNYISVFFIRRNRMKEEQEK
jgi:hypothetical protein